MTDLPTIEVIRYEARQILPDDNFTPLLQEIGDASIVLLGEATHGTREFYTARADISMRLITEQGFDAIAVEADWPDALRVSRHIRNNGDDKTVDEALQGFQRFPQWMWRNIEIVKLVERLRSHNMRVRDPERQVGFYGIDLYSLRKSMEAVVQYLDQVDPEAARRARARYGCFDHLAEDPQHYGYVTTFGMAKDCEEEVVRQLVAMNSERNSLLAQGAHASPDEWFYAQQNARVAKNAEAYYRSMFRGRDESWNLRDTHMADTLDALRLHIGNRKGGRAKIVVWAHNSHIGDARATEMGNHGQLNLGQLVRQFYPSDETFLVGFTTHTGTVTAASEWDAPAELKSVLPSRPDSVERLFHDTGFGNFMLPLRRHESFLNTLSKRRLERAIGVIYLPHSERASHYFHADIVHQFDAVIHLDETTAITPLERSAQWKDTEAPETYPSGI